MHLIVFAKEPVPGRVKTRLVPPLDHGQACSVYEWLLARTLGLAETAHASGVVDSVEICHTPGAVTPKLSTAAGRRGWPLRPQQGGDLGERMERALAGGLARGSPAILIGSDCPEFELADLADSTAALAQNAATFAPSGDGGYVLVGCNRPLPCFRGIPWSTRHVMSATRQCLSRHGVAFAETTVRHDIDDFEGLAAWVDRSGGQVPGWLRALATSACAGLPAR